MKKFLFFGLAASLVALGCASAPHQNTDVATQPAAETNRNPANSIRPDSKNGRDGLVYELRDNGHFFVKLRNGTPCQVTANVRDFRMLPRGANVTAYLTTAGELVMLRMGDDNATQCYSQRDRRTEVTDAQGPVREWNVINAAEVPVVLIALDNQGRLRMYDTNGNLIEGLSVDRVDGYRLHPCHGKRGVPFNSKIAFAIGGSTVLTVEPNGRMVREQGAFNDLNQFFQQRNISQQACSNAR